MTKGTELHKNWYCPSCGKTHQSIGKETAFHYCPSHNGAFIPLALEGTSAVNREVLREDYLKGDLASVRTEDGQVISSIQQETEEGIGGTIFLPCAVFNVGND